MSRPFAVFDIDGTLFRSGLYRELALAMMRRGVVPQTLIDKSREKLRQWKRREAPNAYDQYEHSLIEMLDGSLTSIPTEVFDEEAQHIAAAKLDHIYTYTRSELARLKSAGHFIIAISGSQEELVKPFAEKYGFNAWIGQKYVRESGQFTGEIIKTHTKKDQILRKIVEQHNLTYADSWAFGDSIGDRGLLESVENPVAFNPTIELLELAQKRGWTVVVERKSIVYQLENRGDGLFVLAKTGKI